jgi:hypothetical protein
VIIYASRTHSQLAQVIKELKATKYRPRMAVLGSRTQMCVHKEVRRLTGVAQQTACRQKTESRTCAHYNETDRFLRSDPEYGKREPVDIEDLVKLGEKGKVGGGCGPCPYFMSQDMAARADIVFAPYNYLIDPKLRETFGNRVRWNDAVLLFDEAHNVEGACAEAASFELPAANLAAAVREAQEAFELAAAEEELSAHAAEPDRLLFNARGRGEDDGFGGTGEKLGVNGMKRVDGGDRDGLTKRTALEYKQLRGILLALESKIASELDKGSVKSPGTSAFAEKAHFAKELVKPCAYFFDVLASLRITDEPVIAVSDEGNVGGGGRRRKESEQRAVARRGDARRGALVGERSRERRRTGQVSRLVVSTRRGGGRPGEGVRGAQERADGVFPRAHRDTGHRVFSPTKGWFLEWRRRRIRHSRGPNFELLVFHSGRRDARSERQGRALRGARLRYAEPDVEFRERARASLPGAPGEPARHRARPGVGRRRACGPVRETAEQQLPVPRHGRVQSRTRQRNRQLRARRAGWFAGFLPLVRRDARVRGVLAIARRAERLGPDM